MDKKLERPGVVTNELNQAYLVGGGGGRGVHLAEEALQELDWCLDQVSHKKCLSECERMIFQYGKENF